MTTCGVSSRALHGKTWKPISPCLICCIVTAASQKGDSGADFIGVVLHKKDFIVPIPGMRREERVIENLGAAEVSLTDEEVDSLERELGKITLHGNRTDKDIERLGTVRAQ